MYLFLQLSAVLFPHGGGISFFKCLLIRRSARGLSSEEDDVHKLTSAVLACLSTYVSYDEKSDKKWLIFSPNKNCMDTRALKRKERASNASYSWQLRKILERGTEISWSTHLIKKEVVCSYSLDYFFINFFDFFAYEKVSVQPLDHGRIDLNQGETHITNTKLLFFGLK